ncbi:unnamed protein product [Rhizophagus irregularis]|uniref:Uncharacterized protein n=1 Tax=Rhizophagus irregularis TaxID=588596 RepID=A0A2N1ND84_9GLOM|nr:hypothetical protein RhiirC2_743891 [Rhizophagus irregularis]CAB4378530.1 unnamed protein product [Rhizophagus irregularis]CAB5297337.1 unnamed protein product [Rhizophagus irregularis]
MSINETNVPGDPYSDSSIPYVDFPDNQAYKDDVANQKELQINNYLHYYLSVVSIIGGTIVLLIIIFMYFYDKKLVNRVSLRLTAMISFVDVLSGFTTIAYVDYQPRDTPECTGIATGLSFFPQLYLFLTVMIAFNLQIVFLHSKKVSSFSDRWYIPAALLMALATNIPPLVYNRFGYDSDTRTCIYRNTFSKETNWWRLATFIIPVASSMIYCTTVLVIVVCKLIFEHRQLVEAIPSQSSATLSAKAKRQKLLLLKLVSRISLYAAIPLLTVCGIIVNYTWNSIHGNHKNYSPPKPLIYWSTIGTCLPGFFNFIAFLFDPAIHNAFRKVRKDLIEKYGYSKNPLKATSSLNSPPMSPMSPMSTISQSRNSTNSPKSPKSPQSSSPFPPSQTYHPPSSPNITRITISPASPISSHLSMNNSQISPENMGRKKEKFSFLRWFVRTFLEKKENQPTISITSPSMLSTSLSSDQEHRYSSVTINSGTISGQSDGHDYRVEPGSPLDRKRKTFMKRMSKESSNPLNFAYTTSTTVTSNPSTSNATTNFGDNSRLLYEQHSFNNNGSYLFPPVLGHTTINIHVHQYPGSTMTQIEADIPSTLSGVSGVSDIFSSHRRSDSESSITSRDEIGNELSAY